MHGVERTRVAVEGIQVAIETADVEVVSPLNGLSGPTRAHPQDFFAGPLSS